MPGTWPGARSQHPRVATLPGRGGHRSRSPLWPLGPHGQRPAPRVVLDPPSPERLQPVSSEACPRVGTVALNKARAATQGIHMQLTLLTSPRNHPQVPRSQTFAGGGSEGAGGLPGLWGAASDVASVAPSLAVRVGDLSGSHRDVFLCCKLFF